MARYLHARSQKVDKESIVIMVCLHYYTMKTYFLLLESIFRRLERVGSSISIEKYGYLVLILSVIWHLGITAWGLSRTIQKYLESHEGQNPSASRIDGILNLYVNLKLLTNDPIN